MSTFTNTAREVEMPNGDVVVIHNAPTGGANTTSNIKKFKYDDNGHVTESSAANATDLNLNSYSTPTSGGTAIGTSDAVQTAIGKLDHQSQIDQTNILYALEKVGKNNFNYAYVGDGNNFGKSFTSAHATFEIQSDNTALKITTDGAVTTGNPYIFFMDETGNYINFKKWFDGRHYLTGIPSGASTSTHRIFYKADSQASVSLSTDTLLPDLSTATNIYIGIQVQTGQNYGSTGILYQPMIILDTLYASDPSYEPAALPNYDLTYLEAQDRAALAEEIDAGAKNILKINQASSASAPCFTSDLANTVTINGTIASGGEAFDLNRINGSLVLPAGTYVISTPDDMSNLGFRYYERVGGTLQNQSSERGEKFLIFTVSGSATENWCRLESNVGTAFSNRKVRLMICTKAAFGVSSKFVPYRPDYQALVDKTTEQTFGIFKYNNNYSITAITRKCNGFAWFTLTVTSTANIAANTNTIIGYVDSNVQPVGASTDRIIFTARVNTDTPTLVHSHIRGSDGYIYINSPTAIPAGTSISITGSYKY